MLELGIAWQCNELWFTSAIQYGLVFLNNVLGLGIVQQTIEIGKNLAM